VTVTVAIPQTSKDKSKGKISTMTEQEYCETLNTELPGCIRCPAFSYKWDCRNPYCNYRLTRKLIDEAILSTVVWDSGVAPVNPDPVWHWPGLEKLADFMDGVV
jgi:hypothetical protein